MKIRVGFRGKIQKNKNSKKSKSKKKFTFHMAIMCAQNTFLEMQTAMHLSKSEYLVQLKQKKTQIKKKQNRNIIKKKHRL